MYGVGGHPPERAIVAWGDRRTTVDYPPGALYGLAIVGRLYRAYDPGFRDGRALTVLIKLSILLADVAICAGIWLVLRRHSKAVARTGVLFYWLNPAALLDGAVLGYLDPWAGALVVAALVAADMPSALLCSVLATAATLTKAQAVFVLPAIAIVLMNRSDERRAKAALVALAASIVTIGACLVPFARRGAIPNLVQGVGSLLRHDMLSGTAANLWWIVTWVMRASYAVKDLGAWSAWTMTVRILGVSRVIALGYPNPRPIGMALAGGVMLWTIWRARHGSMPIVAAAGAIATQAYFTLALQVHENHLYLAVPLMGIAAASLPRLRAPFLATSVVFALNLFLFYGIGRSFPLPPRGFTIVDATVVLSFVSVGVFIWNVLRFSEETAHHLRWKYASV
jgi:hypothetical protein